MVSNKEKIQAVRAALSPARMATYESAANVTADDDISALVLYSWNADVSGSLLAPLHICEVVMRNAISEACEKVYGSRWPWSPAFERSLPDPSRGYSPRKDIQNVRKSFSTTGKVIPELKFVFWQKMFTSRYDSRLWNHHLKSVLPNLDQSQSVAILRSTIYTDLEQLRKLRNRIAHHEPIFTRNLIDDYQKILDLVRFRCDVTADWLDENQRAKSTIAAKP